jgi:hypothetical protein
MRGCRLISYVNLARGIIAKGLKELGVKQGIPVLGLKIETNVVNYPEFT